MTKVGIIGTAGRKEDGPKMSRELYFRMVNRAKKEINNHFFAGVFNPTKLFLLSGGAAWSDHVAVSLFLMGFSENLSLYFPCKWSTWNHCFSYPEKVASIANYYHKEFSEKMNPRDTNKHTTLSGIQRAIDKGAKYHEYSGFHERNFLVGQCKLLIAMTWGEGETPKDGGTLHTWNNSNAEKKIHVPLSTL